MSINIILAGPRGKMGKEAIKMIKANDRYHLVATIDRKNNGKKIKDITELPNLNVPIFEDPEECFSTIETDIFIDLTVPETGFQHTKLALEHNIRSITGTTGFTNEQIEELSELSAKNKVGCIIAPNFAIGAILMMHFSSIAAKYFDNVEIIEKHHNQKIDAPSGTALKTAEMIRENRESKVQGHPKEYETLKSVRGGEMDGMRIHSVRLPGLVAHQEVIFGSGGQTLTLKHDSYDRKSFMDGIKLSIEKVMKLEKLIYGLENILLE